MVDLDLMEDLDLMVDFLDLLIILVDQCLGQCMDQCMGQDLIIMEDMDIEDMDQESVVIYTKIIKYKEFKFYSKDNIYK